MRDMTEPLDTYDDQGDYDWDYEESEDRGPRPKVLWGRVISLVLFMLIAFLIGRWSVGGVSEEDFTTVKDQNAQLEEDVAALEQENTELRALVDNQDAQDPGGTGDDGEDEDPEGDDTGGDSEALEAKEYTVESGDTLSAIVKKHYGCTLPVDEEGNEVDLTEATIETNQASAEADGVTFDPAALVADQIILLPPKPTGYDCP